MINRIPILLATLLVAVTALGGVFAGGSAHARERGLITVDDNGDDVTACDGVDPCTLRGAITKANADAGGDIIIVAATDVITLNSALPTISEDVTITGPGSDKLTVDANGALRVFATANGVDADISGMTLSNASSGISGCLLNLRGMVELLDIVATGGSCGNSPTLVTFATVTISNSTFIANSGSGIQTASGATLTLTHSSVLSNTGSGVLHGESAEMTIFASEIAYNTVDGESGGGILSSDDMTIVDSTIHHNAITSNACSGEAGAGLARRGGTLTIRGSTISHNSTSCFGGGLAIRQSFACEPIVVDQSTIAYNAASVGGAVDTNCSTTIVNSTISNNEATGVGQSSGGVRAVGLGSSEFTLVNTTVFENEGGGVEYTAAGSSSFSLTNSIVANVQATGPDCVGVVTRLATDNLDSDGSCGAATTADPLLGLLQNNGGKTETHLPTAASLAIDAGDSATCAAAPVNGVDQRGVVRPQGSDCDLGAVEAAAVPTVVTLQRPTADRLAPQRFALFLLLAAAGTAARYAIKRAARPAPGRPRPTTPLRRSGR